MLDLGAESAFFKHTHHRDVLGENFRKQLLQSGVAGELDKMAHKRRTDALALILVDHGEGDFGCLRSYYDVTRPAHDEVSSLLSCFRNKRHVANEIHFPEISDFFFGKMALSTKKTALKGLRTHFSDGGEKIGPVVRFQRANCELAPIA